jgi:hypothetical protein
MSVEQNETSKAAVDERSVDSPPPAGMAAGVAALTAAAAALREPGRRLSPQAAQSLQRAIGNRATAHLARGRVARQSLQRQSVIEIEVLTEHDSYADRSGTTVRVGDAHGPNVLMNIVDVPGGGVQLKWFNFKTGFAQTGSLAEWNFLSMIDIGGTRDSEHFGRLGRSLSAGEWRRLWPNPVPDVLRRYERGQQGISDEVLTATYRGVIEQAALARLADNEKLIDELLNDEQRVARLEEYARGLKEAAIVRDGLRLRKREVDRQLSISQQAPNIGLPKRQTMAGLDMWQRLRKLQEQSELQEAIDFWEAAFPLLTRLPTGSINAGRVEATLKEIKSNIVVTRGRLLKADLDPWTLQAIRGATDPKLGTRARATVAAEDKSRGRWAWITAGASIAAGIALLFVPGGIFIDAAIGVAMGASAWEDAALAGRAANTGLHVDDGLMTQGQAAGARFAAILATIAAVVGVAFAGLRVLRVGRAFAALGRAMPELELAARARLARLLADDPNLVTQLVRIAEREQRVLPAVREALKEFPSDTFRLRQAVQAIADGYKGPARTAWMHGLHPDALAAIRRATPAELEEIAEMMRGARNRADAEEILRQLTYKGLKAERRGGQAFGGVADAAAKLRSGLKELAEVRNRGFPNGFPNLAAFKRFGQTVRDAVRRYGVDAGEIRVHGSALHNRIPGDIDVAVIADAAKFDSLARQFVEAATSAGHTKLARTIAKEAADGKIPYVRFAPREAGFEFGRVVRTAAGDKPVQVSLIKRGSEFDVGPYLAVP